jgi:hypothetical protein
MNDTQEDKRSMYLAVLEVLEANQTIWSIIPAFATAESNFRVSVGDIQGLVQQQLPSTGVTADKQRLRAEMADAAMPIVGALKALAAVTQNGDLAAQVDLTRSDFVYGRDTIAADNGDAIYALASTHSTDLANYGIDSSHQTAIYDATQAYREALTRPREVIAASAAATEQLDAAFDTADDLLKNQLDNLAEIFRTSQPAFYLQYQNAREIVDSGGGSPPSS